jgi:hypothetical protein
MVVTLLAEIQPIHFSFSYRRSDFDATRVLTFRIFIVPSRYPSRAMAASALKSRAAS